MQAITAPKDESKSRPVRRSAKVSDATVMKYRKMNARIEAATRSGTGLPPTHTGATALGCTSKVSSRIACRDSTSVRNILMPPPIEPVLQRMQDRNNIQIGANTGQRV